MLTRITYGEESTTIQFSFYINRVMLSMNVKPQ